MTSMERELVERMQGMLTRSASMVEQSVAQSKALLADNARLRALVKAQEWGAENVSRIEPICPWCGAPTDNEHAPDCPAFTPTGEVR